MSIEAVLSRIDVIAQAQQQIASPIGSSASAGAIGALLGGAQTSTAQPTGSAATTFASALATARAPRPRPRPPRPPQPPAPRTWTRGR
jgi:hypothetical protein